jgi:uncharacterized protein (TIGR00255 family)
MTGFGRAITAYAEEQIAVEVSAVNHRFLESSFRMPPAWACLEVPLRELVKQAITRGKINISVRREYGPSGRVRIRLDEEVAAHYVAASRRLAEVLNTSEELSLDRLVTLEGVFIHEDAAQDIEAVQAMLEAALGEALRAFNQARDNEGAALLRDMSARLDAIEASVVRVEARFPEISVLYLARLTERVRELTVEANVKEERVAVEVAMMADRMDVTEETVRLRAHLEHGRALFRSSEPVGRDLNFLVQEMGREINTMGSKIRDVEAAREVLLMKSELEKLREQIQNIE